MEEILMKKAIATFIVIVMLLAIAACGNGADTSDAPTSESGSATPSGPPPLPPVEEQSPFPNANPDGTINLDTIAHFDHTYNYSQNPRWEIAFIAHDNTALIQRSADAFEHWAPLFNMEWAGFISAGADPDLFMTQLQNLIDQGVDAIIVEPDMTIIPAVLALLDRYPEVAWMTQMAVPRDGTEGTGIPFGGNMVNNHVGFDNLAAGVQMAAKLIEWHEESFPNVPWRDVGFIALNFSVIPSFNQRVAGSRNTWQEHTGSLDNFFEADALGAGLSMQGAMDVIAPIISMNDQFRHWLVMGNTDDFAQGAAAILGQQGLEDTSCVVTMGGSNLIAQWDAGQRDSFRFALFTAQTLYAEPIMGALYAYLNGWATPNTIWPSWVNLSDHGADGSTFSQRRLPTVWLAYETYQHYLAWTDIYTHANQYPNYSKEGITPYDYDPHAPVPRGFAGNP
jgi:ABC-type sugar transport system substrate-binding protein